MISIAVTGNVPVPTCCITIGNTIAVSGALIGMIPLVFVFLLTAMVFPMVIPQVGTGTFPVTAMDIMSGVFYTHPLVYNLIFVLIDGCFWGLLNCAVFWSVNFVRNRFWILLTPFIIYKYEYSD